MAKNPLKKAADATGGGEDQVKSGTVTGASAKGYAEHHCDGSSYDKYGCRLDYSQLAAHSFK